MTSLEGCTLSNRARSVRLLKVYGSLPGRQYLIRLFGVVASSHDCYMISTYPALRAGLLRVLASSQIELVATGFKQSN